MEAKRGDDEALVSGVSSVHSSFTVDSRYLSKRSLSFSK